MPNLALPSSATGLKLKWTPPEILAASVLGIGVIVGGAIEMDAIIRFVNTLLVDTLHMAFLGITIAAVGWLLFSKKSHLIFRVLMRSVLSLFVSVFPKQIVEDKLIQMKKRRDAMNDQIAAVRGSIESLKRVIAKNHSDAVQGFGMASAARKQAAQMEDPNEAHRRELQTQLLARKAERREQSNIGFAALLDKLTKVYNFLDHYSTNIDFFIEDTEDEIQQKTMEYDTVNTATGAMKTAMKVISGNASDEDFYNQAFQTMEDSISKNLGMMEDLQRVSQNFVDGIDVQKGAVDEDALNALDAFEAKALTGDKGELQMLSSSSRPTVGITSSRPRALAAAAGSSQSAPSDDFDPYK